TTRKADLEIVHRLRQHLQVRDQDQILDVACGTGNYTAALSQLGVNITGVDISEEMLAKARQKSYEISWIKADATHLPFDEDSYNGATCVLAIHHFDDLLKTFREVHRVLDNGRFVIFTSSPEQMRSYWLNAYFPIAMEASIRQMPSMNDVIMNLREVGFSIVGVESFLIEKDLQDFFLYSGKYAPQMYLESTVRSGISTFANIATPEEIASGCRHLKHDIENGEIHDVIQQYTSILGDYAFIVAQK
ncbi:MAG: class I SAM-dependent methyltransferase, partial [Acidibacillus sp.]|nr:class I SAM-dependent methyltransferase [Acidibacillus sp.]